METLFHYCSNEAFVSILRSRSLWLSALTLSNDNLEGRWARKIFDDAIMGFDPKMDSHDWQLLSQCLDDWQSRRGVLGACLSEAGDILSQWRAYADEGRGVAIGFCHQLLSNLPLQHRKGWVMEPHYGLDKVVYDETEQKEIATSRIKNFLEASKISEINAFRLGPQKSFKLFEYLGFELMTLIHQFKNPAFAEECEWRFCRHLTLDKPADRVRTFASLDFRNSDRGIIPYSPLPLPQGTAWIKSIVLGPRNPTPVDVVKAMLVKFEFNNIVITSSTASLR